MQYKTVVDALSNNDLVSARDILLAEILEKTKDKNSWDHPLYSADKNVQAKIELKPERNNKLTYFGLQNLQERYFLKDVNDEKLKT